MKLNKPTPWNLLLDWLCSLDRGYRMSRGMLEELKALKPGQLMTVTTRHGEELCVMHKCDFEHVSELAKLRLKDVS